MTGIKEYNVPEFNRQAEALKDAYYEVFNPAATTLSTAVQNGHADANRETYRVMLSECLEYITLTATHMYMLRGWELSKGARAEHAAAVACGLTILYQP